MARTSAVVCVGRCAFHCSYHSGVAAPLQEWNESLGEDVHACERRRIDMLLCDVCGQAGGQAGRQQTVALLPQSVAGGLSMSLSDCH